ncbi:hypothetical protein [Fodinibius sp. Rm-B-1B1-1]|uniref:hypothetical protein n=1 Tax=Fodinibius alkaliphilus TaxID=3140241 RepID=UPI00315A961E
MNYIEIIGPPGVGKSTLLKALVNRRKNERWKTYQEAIINIANTLKWKQLGSSKSQLLYVLNKINVSKYKELGLANTIVQYEASQIANSIKKKYEYFVDAEFEALNKMPLRISAINKSSFLSWHIKSLNKLFIMEAFGYMPTVIFAEGPCKTHHGLKYIQEHKVTADTLPRAIIYCTLSAKDNIKRIQTRATATGSVSTIHNQLNDEQLETLVLYTHQVAEENLTFLKRLGIPTYELNLTDTQSDVELNHIQDFITENINNSRHSLLDFARIYP